MKPTRALAVCLLVFATSGCTKQPTNTGVDHAQSSPRQHSAPPTPDSPPVADEQAQADAGKCVADPAWLSSSELPGEVLGDGSCGVYRLGWANFLHISSEEGNGRRYDRYSDSESLFPPNGGTPPPWGTQTAAPGCKAASGDVDLLELGKISNVGLKTELKTDQEKEISPDSIQQAGSEDPLIDQNGRPIYYSIQTNRILYDYVASCQLYKRKCYDTIGEAISFPEQAVELKVAWRVLETCKLADSPKQGCKPDDPSRFLTTMAVIEPYRKSGGPCGQVLVGMVGMHIVHKVPSLPSMTWTTIEHVDNAPDCKSSGEAPSGGWLFYNPDCGDAYQCVTNQYCNPCSKKCSDSGGYDASCKKPAIPTQVCRETPILDEVEALNRSVREMLPAGDPRRNYLQVGTIYKAKGQVTGPDVGSLYLANTTMETYVQVFAKTPGPPVEDSGCLSCHNSTYYSSDNDFEQADFSHMFRRIRNDGACSANLPSRCK